MRRIFWDTLLFVYLLEDDDASTRRVEYLLQLSRDRGDSLFTSHLVLGELLTGAKKLGRENLSCAAAARMDLFLTGDKDLMKLHVPGIHFIANFDTTVL